MVVAVDVATTITTTAVEVEAAADITIATRTTISTTKTSMVGTEKIIVAAADAAVAMMVAEAREAVMTSG